MSPANDGRHLVHRANTKIQIRNVSNGATAWQVDLGRIAMSGFDETVHAGFDGKHQNTSVDHSATLNRLFIPVDIPQGVSKRVHVVGASSPEVKPEVSSGAKPVLRDLDRDEQAELMGWADRPAT